MNRKIINKFLGIAAVICIAALAGTTTQSAEDPFKKGPQSEAGANVAKSAAVQLAEKMKKIIIPKLEFRDARIDDVINYLQQQSIAFDKDSPPAEKGVNIILKLKSFQGTADAPANMPAITLFLKNLSLMDAFKYITEYSGLKYRIEENTVVVYPADMAYGEMQTRTYLVQPSLMDLISGGPARGDLKKFFSAAGVSFPEGSSINSVPEQGQLVVKNTTDNLEVLERLLSKLNVFPAQVSVEMRMIEMPRLAADELFKEEGGLAKAFVLGEKTLGAVNEMVIQGKAKVVSQSKVITKSGSNCENKTVHEFTYPTAYDVSGSEATNSVQALPDSRSNATNSVKVLPGILIPTGFETRDCGTILQITPVIGPDNQTIDCALVFQRVRLSAYPNKVMVNSPSGKIEVEQPVFLSEQVTTSLTVQNGTTALFSVCDTISDQEKQEKASENIILFIMTACVVPVK